MFMNYKVQCQFRSVVLLFLYILSLHFTLADSAVLKTGQASVSAFLTNSKLYRWNCSYMDVHTGTTFTGTLSQQDFI